MDNNACITKNIMDIIHSNMFVRLWIILSYIMSYNTILFYNNNNTGSSYQPVVLFRIPILQETLTQQ